MEPYSYGSVTVDDDHVRVGSQSYAINKLKTVDVREDTQTSTAWIFTAFLGVCLIVGGAGLKQGEGIAAIVVGVLLLALTGALFWARTTHSQNLYVTSALGDHHVLRGERPALEELRDAIALRITRTVD